MSNRHAEASARAGRLIGYVVVLGLTLALAACGGGGKGQATPTIDAAAEARARNARLDWLINLEDRSEQTVREISDPALVRRVERAARSSGARVLDVRVLGLSEGKHAPVVTLQSDDPASYMKHRLMGFLKNMGYLDPDGYAFVELLDEHGRFAWTAGHWPSGGMVGSRLDLDQCSPISHSQLVGSTPPPCPAD